VIALTREVDQSTLDDLEPVLLAADIGSATTAIILETLRQRALRVGIESGDELKVLLRAELQKVLDGVAKPVKHPATAPEVIMMVGVNGTGKTTTSGKLAQLFTSQGRSVLLCAADTFRAAAIEQLEVWATRSGVQIIKTKQGGDPSAALYDACTAAKARGTQVLIVDTAGRLHTKTDLMKELDKMRRTAEKLVPGAPHQTLLVMDATTGQNGLQQARLFTEAARVTGIVLTKLDGTAKGGIVLAIATELGLPVVYAGTGEKIDDLIPFDSKSFIDSLVD
jgi:fused signal recognition particle receptor